MLNPATADGRTFPSLEQAKKDLHKARRKVAKRQSYQHEPIRKVLTDFGTHENTSGDGYKRTLNNRQWRSQVVEALVLTGFEKEANLFGSCSEHPLRWISPDKKNLPSDAETVWACSHDDTHPAALFSSTCDLRICPDCAARQTARLAARYMPVAIDYAMRGGKHGLRHIVFTTPLNLTSDTPEKISAQADEYAKIPRRVLERVQKLGKEYGRDWSTIGAIQSEEYGTDGLKLHFHVVQAGAYIPQDTLSKIYAEETGNKASVVFVRKIGNGSPEEVASDVIETLKYSVKFHSTDNETGEVKYIPPNVMPHLLKVLKGRRRIRSWGCFYNLPKIQKEPFLCQECNHEMERIGLENWELWLEYRATNETVKLAYHAFLNLKLANKSNFDKPKGSKSAPTTGSSPPIPDQKPLWETVDKDNFNHYERE